MNSRIALLAAISAGHVGVLVLTWAELPAEGALQFGRYGRPTRWAAREEFGVLTIATAAAVILLPLLLRWLIRVLPSRWLSVPRKSYWFHPEREKVARDLLGYWILGVGVLTGAFTLAVTWLVADANLQEPVRVPNIFFLYFAIFGMILMVAVAVLVFRLVRGSA